MPIYNVQDYIEHCIKSICEQTYQNLEILLIDDGATDNSGLICDEYAKKDKRIQVFHIENSGQSHARNVGLEAATGDYIGFVDGDDYICVSMYEKLLKVATEYRAQVVECNFHGRKKEAPDEIEEGLVIEMTGKEAITRQLDGKCKSRFPSTSVWSKLFKREILQGLLFPNGRIHEEFAFLCEAFLNADRYVYINECLYERILRKDSTTAEKFSKKTLDKIYVYRQRNDVLLRRKEYGLYCYSKALEYELLLHYVSLAWQEGLFSEEKILTEMIELDKRHIMTSMLPIRKKIQYALFFINKEWYFKIRDEIRKRVAK